MRRGLVLVSYYLGSMTEVNALLDSFEANARYYFDTVIVVDNAGAINAISESGDREIQVIRGSNSFWEFSGWLEGLDKAESWEDVNTITLLNDSYQRNWEISYASRYFITNMFRSADHGFISGWLDNFSWFRRPRFSRRPNSRVMIFPWADHKIVSRSISMAIDKCGKIISSGGNLFTRQESDRLNDWLLSQTGRWPSKTLSKRMNRIYIEHHIFDEIPKEKIILYPRMYLSSIFYALIRRLVGERR